MASRESIVEAGERQTSSDLQRLGLRGYFATDDLSRVQYTSLRSLHVDLNLTTFSSK